MSKYRNRKTEIDGIVFDSASEARRWQELKILEAAGEIRNLKRQPRYELIPAFKHKGKTERAVVYIPDYEYEEAPNWTLTVEDRKGVKTQVFIIKRKLFLQRYPNIEFKVTAA